MKINFTKYVDLPYRLKGRDFSGVDCYGLVYLIFREELGITLSDFTKIDYSCGWTKFGKNHILENITNEWGLVKDGNFKMFDCHLFRDTTGLLAHVGINIGGDRFLHSLEDFPVSISKLDVWNKKLGCTMRYLAHAKN